MKGFALTLSCFTFTVLFVTIQGQSLLDKIRTRNMMRQVNMNDDDMSYLDQFGYMSGEGEMSTEKMRTAIENFQRMAHIRVTGRMDFRTRLMMKMPRCGMADMGPDSEMGASQYGVRITKRQTRNGGWRKRDLTWRLENFTPDMAPNIQRDAFRKAFKHWSDVTPLTFRELQIGAPGRSDIRIRFMSSGRSFGRRGGVLAYAFFPENGNTRFDESERWTANNKPRGGIDLEIVATHEIGHLLGLPHSRVRGAVLAPFYGGYERNFALRRDDIQRIQRIYGRNTRPPTPQPTVRPTPRPTPRPTRGPTTGNGNRSQCSNNFRIDGMMEVSNSNYYVFSGSQVYRLTAQGTVARGYPRAITADFPSAPSNIDAATHSDRTGFSYLFKGKKLFKYRGNTLISRTTISDPRFPSSIQGALTWRNGNLFIFNGNQYYQLLEGRDSMRIARGYPAPITRYWRNIPGDLDATIVTDANRFSYFFKGNSFYKFDNRRRNLLPGYPRATGPTWFGC
ncbi:matrix metalloproteinase-16 [Lingula anatina]|uniref:Matrix metalloproteinase-16 n=1 Tax=Lingula anatina TaxID=7574 RepID=A0A1S3IXA2_LINAN|nr:matrix metalloproteinase-16 [Lingula anatina]|eukprot:XP_013402591.1 matrix metalloproteinase-16 [Lingula anatina]